MSDMMTFPATVEEFMEQYKIVDDERVYTNGAELVPIFRMMQWFEHVSATDINVGTTISRQQAIDALKELTANGTNKGMINGEDAVHRIEMLPSTQPEVFVWCVGCKEYDQEKHCCHRWTKVIRNTVAEMKDAQPEIIRCKDCNHFYKDELTQWCFLGKYGVKENGFCSRAERRTDEE